MDISTTTTLNNGIEMPIVGLGTYKSTDGDEVTAVKWALDAGYRAIDTASMYQNEAGISTAIAESDLAREDVFVTSKVWNSDQGYDNTLKAFASSLERLGGDYIDLYLIHWPSRAHMADTWKAMEEIYDSGAAKAIGVSNFHAHHLDELLSFANTPPAVNQVEHHPLLQQPDLLSACASHDIKITAWAPLIRGRINEIGPIVAIAAEVGATPAQVTLRWMLERGVIVIPKSVRQERIIENADLFGFELSPAHIDTINSLDANERTGPNPDQFPGT